VIRWPGDAPLPSRVVKAAARGDTAAMAQILCNFRPLIRHVVQKVPVEYREDVEDEIYLGLLASLTAFDSLAPDGRSVTQQATPLIKQGPQLLLIGERRQKIQIGALKVSTSSTDSPRGNGRSRAFCRNQT